MTNQLKPVGKQVSFEEQMKVARAVMHKDREALAAMAEFDRTGKYSDSMDAEIKKLRSKK